MIPPVTEYLDLDVLVKLPARPSVRASWSGTTACLNQLSPAPARQCSARTPTQTNSRRPRH